MKQTFIDVFFFSFIGFFSEFFIDYVLRKNTIYLPDFLNVENFSDYIIPTLVVAFFIIGFYKAGVKEHLKNILFIFLLCLFVLTINILTPLVFDEVNVYGVLLTVYTYSVLAFLTSLLKYIFGKNNVTRCAKFTKYSNKNE